MGWVCNAGRVCRIVILGLVLSAALRVQHPMAILAVEQPIPAANSGDPATFGESLAETNINPLRAPLSLAQSPAPTARTIVSPTAPLVPNTGRLRIFKIASNDATGSVDAARGVPSPAQGGLFPGNQLLTALVSPPLHVMRFEDVAQGAAVIPVTPARRAKEPSPSPSAAKPTAEATKAKKAPPLEQPLGMTKKRSDATSSAESAVRIERLPPLSRTAPPPALPPGVKLPQQPIEVYPETGL